ncbi:MAG: serine dehydratase subunit alpha family protein [Atopobiaceae bacterium]|nr:serine dehydratase subunit alpha family protein [Atopobiaceae bacterium]
MEQYTSDFDVCSAILNEELVCALGCTEPIALAYAAALARAALGEAPQSLEVACSGNVIKNVKSVTVPNSGGMRGIEAAVALGWTAGDETKNLEVLEGAGDAERAAAQALIDSGIFSVTLAEGVPNLFVEVVAHGDAHSSLVRIEDRHTHVTRLERDGQPLAVGGVSTDGVLEENLLRDDMRSRLSLELIWEFAHKAELNQFADAIEQQLELNGAIAQEGLGGTWGAHIGKTLLDTRPDDVSCRARAMAAAGSDARMSGCSMPVVICCGSGNQGITSSLPVREYAHDLGSSREELLRAVALSDLTSVHVKRFIGELSAFCGAVSAAAGAAGAICMLKGGSFEQYQAAVVNTLANVGGIVCDGAKPSCAAKIASAVDAGILGCDMALANADFLPGEGLVAESAERTIRSMGYVGRVGMHPTDVEILNIMIGKTDPENS